MPNWVSIVVNFEGKQKDINNIFNLIKGVDEDGEVREFDFNRLIPMPEELDIECGSKGDRGLVYLYQHTDDTEEKKIIAEAFRSETYLRDITTEKPIEDIDEATIEQGKKYLSNYKKYGCCGWYKWRINNWGTKWNACNVNVNNKSIYFDTAWSFPTPIFEKLSEICEENNVEISGYFCDEDWGGSNKGYFDNWCVEYVDTNDLENEMFKEIFINCMGEDYYYEMLEEQSEKDEAV